MTWNATNVRRSTQAQQALPQTEPYWVTHDFDGPATLSTTLVHAVSEATNTDVSNAEETLSHQVDLQAIDYLFRPVKNESPRAHGHLSISVWGHDVTIYGDGRILISSRSR